MTSFELRDPDLLRYIWTVINDFSEIERQFKIKIQVVDETIQIKMRQPLNYKFPATNVEEADKDENVFRWAYQDLKLSK